MRDFQIFERQQALQTQIFGKQSDDMKRLFENVGLDDYDLESEDMSEPSVGDDIEVTEISDIEDDIDSDIDSEVEEDMTESEIIEEIETKLSSITDLLSKLKTA